MNAFAIVLISIGIIQAGALTDPTLNEPHSNKTITDDTLKKLLEYVKTLASEVETIPDIHSSADTEELFYNVTTTNATVEDLRSFEIIFTHADMNNLTFAAKVRFPELSLTGLYSVKTSSEDFELTGDGPFRIDVKNLSVTLNISLDLLSDDTLEMKDLFLDYEVQEIKVELTMLGGNEMVSHTLNQLLNIAVPELLESLKPNVEEMAKEKVQDYSGFILGGMTVEDFVDFIYDFIPT